MCVKNSIEIDMINIESKVGAAFAKIRLFSVSCCEPPNRSRVKVEVDSGSPVYEVEKPWYDPVIPIYQEPSYLLESTSHDYYMNGGSMISDMISESDSAATKIFLMSFFSID